MDWDGSTRDEDWGSTRDDDWEDGWGSPNKRKRQPQRYEDEDEEYDDYDEETSKENGVLGFVFDDILHRCVKPL